MMFGGIYSPLVGFLPRRRQAQFQQQLAGGVDMLDTLVESPLKDGLAQEIRVAVEQRLEQDWQMPAFWSQLGVDYTNAREDVCGEADSYAFTDAMVLGYALRWVESDRADGRSVPDDIALQLEDLGQDHQGRALEFVVDVAGSRLSEIRTLTGEAWDEFDYWAWQFVAKRSRTRRGSLIRDWVDYGTALAFGYVLRCSVEVSGPPEG